MTLNIINTIFIICITFELIAILRIVYGATCSDYEGFRYECLCPSCFEKKRAKKEGNNEN